MRMTIADTEIKVAWENNPSVKALEEMCRDGELTIQMSRYGGFEQVGSIGKSLPRKDVQTKTSPGDIVLYSGSQMVMFYGSNSWAYTRLGKMTGYSEKELKRLLGTRNVTVTLDAAESK
nr:cyclophilin-like fold protein [uncultured Anaerostipes sp.]